MSPVEARLLRIYLNADERWGGKPLYQAAVESARALGIAGASVFLVELSYGAHHRLRDAMSEYASFEIPVVVEVADRAEQVERLMHELNAMVAEGLLAVRPALVHRGLDGRTSRARRDDEADLGERFESTTGDAMPMRIEGEAQRLSVYVGHTDAWRGGNLAVGIVERCREMGMAGATASRGLMGFGANSVIHRAHLLGLSDDVPEKVEVIDRAERIARLLPVLDEMVRGGLIVVEDVRVVRYLREPKAE